MLKKSYSKTKPVCKVTFTLPTEAANGAKDVRVLGDFNNWSWENGFKMKAGKKEFSTAVELEAGRTYEFRYLIDNHVWENDWAADSYTETGFYGTTNSVVTLEKPAAKKPVAKKAPARKADKSAGDGSQPTQGSSVKPAHEESEQDGEEISEEEATETISKSLTKNGMVAQIYDMMKTMSKDELSEKFGLIQDVVELDLQELNKETSDEEVVAEAQEKILYSRKDLTADEIELDTESDIQAIAGEELSEDFKEKAKGIFEAAVKSKVVEEVNKRVTQIEEEYLEEIEQSTKNFQAEMVEKVDNYLNYVVEEWMKENELAIEKGIRNELTEDFMNGLRNLFKEHYIDVPEEKIDIVDDLFEKVEELEDKLNEQIECQSLAIIN